MNLAHAIVSSFDPGILLLHDDPVGSIVSHVSVSQVTSALDGMFAHTEAVHEKLVPFKEELKSLLVGCLPKSLETHDIIEFIETHIRSKVTEAIKCFRVTIREAEQNSLEWHIRSSMKTCSTLPDAFELAARQWRSDIIHGSDIRKSCSGPIRDLVQRAVPLNEKFTLDQIASVPFRLQFEFLEMWAC